MNYEIILIQHCPNICCVTTLKEYMNLLTASYDFSCDKLMSSLTAHAPLNIPQNSESTQNKVLFTILDCSIQNPQKKIYIYKKGMIIVCM